MYLINTTRELRVVGKAGQSFCPFTDRSWSGVTMGQLLQRLDARHEQRWNETLENATRELKDKQLEVV